MAEVVGKNARIYMGKVRQGGMKDWSINYSIDTVETTTFDDAGIKQYLGTLVGWSGSFNGFGQPGWTGSAVVGTQYLGSFFISASTGSSYTGSVLITGASPSVSVDGVAEVSYTFQGTGALTLS